MSNNTKKFISGDIGFGIFDVTKIYVLNVINIGTSDFYLAPVMLMVRVKQERG
jgi:hypothetical protein